MIEWSPERTVSSPHRCHASQTSHVSRLFHFIKDNAADTWSEAGNRRLISVSSKILKSQTNQPVEPPSWDEISNLTSPKRDLEFSQAKLQVLSCSVRHAVFPAKLPHPINPQSPLSLIK
jgi:hypothetical protein